MTFLQLVQALKREASVSGVLPSTVIGQSGETERLIQWIQAAHNSVQTERLDWKFLWKTATVASSSKTPALAADVNMLDVNRFLLNGVPIQAIEYIDYETPLTATTAKPGYVIIMPNNTIMYDNTPDVSYTLTYDYYRTPLVLAADSDTPLIPVQFQMAIIGDALMRYANYESAGEIYAQGSAMFQEHMRKLLNYQSGYAQMYYQRSHDNFIIIPE
jgi:hypothetical protein